ncbi:MAG TPA: tRNA (guanosine(37)-N1)-methyltransferase TrmD [Candidatus Stercoripulliclostridium merdigallinarum]|uniref:tRNA (guanine-N(1)-)-methyltransferase n=1 Tax=Candidatus Stercoripulliclostridium merdigallinarum TaxID=2840951 RepID=A0A9D1MH00_9FIRM|nr:tRNA (guanosine(37)-N1)-methyltransferase TrmD [Candidatus Stercoripulliclostridium merdigallinarum]
MKISVLTIFPEMYSPLKESLVGKALEKGLVRVDIVNIRDYSANKHKKTDDYPFGGGAGMVMTPQPIHDAINAVDPERKALRIYMSPKGKTLDQETVVRLASADELLLLNGAYEGVDQRVIDLDIDEELSIGDYVLTSGDLASMVVIDALMRYIPGVLGSEESTSEESFSEPLLEYPQYTRPQNFMGLEVPEVLISGHHAQIAAWRLKESIKLTEQRRPDLIEKYNRINETKEINKNNKNKEK